MTNLQTILLDELIALKKHVNRLLAMGILFIVMAQFFIVIPYFQYQQEEKKLLLKWNKNTEHLKISKQKLAKVNNVDMQIKSVLKEVKRDIQNFPQELRKMLPKINKEFSTSNNSETRILSQQTQQYRTSPILPSEIQTFEEGVNWYTKDRLNSIAKKLKESIVIPLNNLNMFSKNKKIEDLFQKSDSDISFYITKINPEFWHTYTGKGHMAQNFSNVISTSFKPIFTEITNAQKKLTARKNLKQNEYTSFEVAMKKLKKLKSNLKNRLKVLESPIGKLPVGLIDFIKIFPIIVVIFILMLTLNVSRSSYLHQKLNQNIELEKKSIDESIFNNIIECWYLATPQKKLKASLFFSILIGTLFIYLHAIYLLIKSQGLFISVIVQEESLQRSFYIGFYLLGGVIILTCLAHIRKLNTTLSTTQSYL